MNKIRTVLLASALSLVTLPALAVEGSIGLTAGAGTNAALTAADVAGFVSFMHAICGGASATMGTACANQLIVNSSGQFLTLSSQSGTWNITNISGTVSLPTGAATATHQTDGSQKTQVVDSGNTNLFTSGNPGVVSGGASQATNSTPINISSGSLTTQLVALSSGKVIQITHWDVIAAGTGNITLEYGTGSLCAGGTTALTGTYNLTAQTGLAPGTGLGPILFVPASNALCAVTTAAMAGSVSYLQF
jgi:hypothetical protein